jgi:hypothetical protein
MYRRIVTVLLTCLIIINSMIAQEVKRPSVWGIAKMTFLVSNIDMAREYYGRFLGFDEAFSYLSPWGTVTSFKINDRQFIEFIVDEQATEKKTPRFYLVRDRICFRNATLFDIARCQYIKNRTGWSRQ